jgi:glycosyltransferase involved in cell wall biosynthesis
MTVWYDYTTSLRATSRNGIAATEWRIGHELAHIDAGMRAFHLAPGRRLVEVDAASQLPSAIYADPHAVLTSVSVTGDTWRSDVRALLVSTLGPVSTPVIQSLTRARVAVARWRSAVRGLRRPMPGGAAIADVVGPDDIVVSMGADWAGDLLRAIGDLKRRTGCRVVVMVYDLIPLTHTHLAFHKEPALFDRYYRQVLEVADLVTCISEASRSDLADFAAARSLAMPPAEVLHLGDTDRDVGPASVSRERFFLWVGTIERRKNLELLYDALRILESEGAELPTIAVVGSPGWGVDDLLAEIRLGSTRSARALVLLGGVPDDTLASLYERAAALLFPSHYEGWGLPLREAAIRGCPVAAGDTPASHEALAGFDGATFLPTDDPGPWASYLAAVPAPVAPASVNTWAATTERLVRLVGVLGSEPLSRDRR